VKYERDGAMLTSLSNIFETFAEFNEIACVVVTHWDTRNSQETEARVRKFFLDNAGIKRVVFTGRDTSALELCRSIANVLPQKPLTISIKYEDLYYKFDILPAKLLIKQKIATCTTDFKKVTEQLIKAMVEYQGPERDSFLHCVIVEVATLAREATNAFVEKMGNILEIDNYAAFMELKKKVAKEVENVRAAAYQRMSPDLLDADNPRMKFRKCQYCGEIWVKVEACDGATKCGRRPFSKDVSAKPSETFKFSFDKVMKWVKKTEKKLEQDPKYYKGFKEDDRKVGCGKTIVWSEQPILTEREFAMVRDVPLNDILAVDDSQSDAKDNAIKEIEKIDKTIVVNDHR